MLCTQLISHSTTLGTTHCSNNNCDWKIADCTLYVANTYNRNSNTCVAWNLHALLGKNTLPQETWQLSHNLALMAFVHKYTAQLQEL